MCSQERFFVAFGHYQTCNTSPSRATISYSTGLTKNPRKSREINPATMTISKGLCVSEPIPVESAAGSNPRQATRAVITIGRSRSSEASRVAVRMHHLPRSRRRR